MSEDNKVVVTGFGLLGHLSEMCEGSGLIARIQSSAIPRLDAVEHYLQLGAVPGGTQRNYDSYGHKIGPISDMYRQLLCDPQTSGGLLVAVNPEHCETVETLLSKQNIPVHCIGELEAATDKYLVLVD